MEKKLGVMIHTFNSNTGEAKQADVCELKAILIYIMCSRPAKAKQWETLEGVGNRGFRH